MAANTQAQAPPGAGGQPARHRRVYEPTKPGRAAHATWLHTPAEPATVSRDLGLHLMRFVMMEHVFPAKDVLAFLQSLADALAVFTAGLEEARAAADPGDRHPRLALDHGLAVYRASLRWADDAIAALSAVPSGA